MSCWQTTHKPYQHTCTYANSWCTTSFMWIKLYIYKYMYMYITQYLHVHTSTYTCMYMYITQYLHVHVHHPVSTCTRINQSTWHVHVHVHHPVSTCLCTSPSIYMYMYKSINLHVHVRVYHPVFTRYTSLCHFAFFVPHSKRILCLFRKIVQVISKLVNLVNRTRWY